MMGEHGHFDVEQRRAHRGAEQRLVPGIVGVRHHRHAAGQQLGPSRVDQQIRGIDLGVEIVWSAAGKLVQRPRVGIGWIHLGLGDGRAVVDVVQRRRVLLVRLAARQIVQERQLADPLGTFADGGIEE